MTTAAPWRPRTGGVERHQGEHALRETIMRVPLEGGQLVASPCTSPKLPVGTIFLQRRASPPAF